LEVFFPLIFGEEEGVKVVEKLVGVDLRRSSSEAPPI
jgi:hypothetical protein